MNNVTLGLTNYGNVNVKRHQARDELETDGGGEPEG
jgi:hypothetical protein